MWIFIVIGLVLWLIIAIGIGLCLGQVIRHRDEQEGQR